MCILSVTVKHRSRVAQDPTQPNLRQVHLIHEELFAEVSAEEFKVRPGDLGENITTRDIDLLGLPVGTLLSIGDHAVLEVTGLRNPCLQIDNFQDGLLKQVVGRDEAGNVVRRAGIMSIVKQGGPVGPGDTIKAELPADRTGLWSGSDVSFGRAAKWPGPRGFLWCEHQAGPRAVSASGMNGARAAEPPGPTAPIARHRGPRRLPPRSGCAGRAGPAPEALAHPGDAHGSGRSRSAAVARGAGPRR